LGLTVVQYEEKYVQSKVYIEPIYAVLQRQEHRKMKMKPRMLGIDEIMEKMF